VPYSRRLDPTMLSVKEGGGPMKILIALDASPQSQHALRFVGRMRWPAGSRVIVVSALPTLVGTAAAGIELSSLDAVSSAQRSEVEELVAAAEAALRESGIPTESRIEAGDPREVLVSVAEAEHADLIVVGSHGRKGLAKLMLGSVSSHVVTHASSSVLVVKDTPVLTRKGGKS
jgi:nucleotide-binding universal stress UspA family protein